MAELTSAEARTYLNDEAVILLPMGSMEDQGTHAPMGDYLAAEAVALEIARSARAVGVPTFVAPVIPFGGWDGFGSSHGADPLTSVGLHFFPDLFRLDLIQAAPKALKVKGVNAAGFSAISYDGVLIQAPIEVNEAAPGGVWGGDPHACSAETGAALVDRLVAIGTGFIRDHVSQGFRESANPQPNPQQR